MIASVLALLCAGAWVGAIVFQSALVAPAVFGELDAAAARRVLRRLFPRFFLLGLGLVGLALGAVLVGPLGPAVRSTAVATLATMLLANALALALVPAINAASDTGNPGRFRLLHGASVLLTLATLGGAIAVIVVLTRGMGAA